MPLKWVAVWATLPDAHCLPPRKISLVLVATTGVRLFSRTVLNTSISPVARLALWKGHAHICSGAASPIVFTPCRTGVECYNEAINAIIDGTYTDEKIADWNERLAKVFNRGFWDGYYLGQRLGEWTSKYGSSATRVKVYAAKGIRYFSKLGVAEFQMEAGELHVGDEIVITGPTTGALPMTVEEIRVDLKPVEMTKKGERFSIKTDTKIRPSDKLFLWQKVEHPQQ